MSCSVNLVPAARLHAQARARRRIGWLIVGAIGALLVGAGWGVQHIAAAGLARLAEHVAGLEVQHAEAQRRLLASQGQRDALLDQLRVVATARRPQPWAHRLTALARQAPPGVFLTELVVTTPEGPTRPTEDATGEHRRAAAAAHTATARTATGRTTPTGSPQAQASSLSPPQAPQASPPQAPQAQAVRLVGYAVDHGALIQMLQTLESDPEWGQVELVRATLEPLRGGVAVAFQFDCRTGEGRP
ncbi:MAG: PilN domain-containing protein [Phycisphaerae bacterium]|jgi:hypothetical protein